MIQKEELSLVHEVMEPRENSEKPPLLLMLHGYGSNELDLYSMASTLNRKFMIVSARAPLALPWGGFAWYEINFNETGAKMSNLEQARSSLEKLRNFIKEVQQVYHCDPEQIWLMGFSQGCILSYALALNDPSSFRGILALSGYILKDMVPEKYDPSQLNKLDFFVTHGTQDTVLPVEWARESAKVLEQLRISHQYREYPMGHGINPECFEDIRKWLISREML